MTRNVRALNRAQKLNLIKLTMLALQTKLYYLQENYNTYHENYSNEAMQLYNASFRFDSAVNNLVQSEGMDRLDDNGLTAMAELSLQVSELYKLGVRTPDDQKEYEATIKQFKNDVYAEALKRLEANKIETNVYENKLISEIGKKDGKNLKGVYEYFDIQKQITENENKISYAEMTGNNQDYTIYCAKRKEFKRRKEILRQDTPLIAHIYSEETLAKDIRNLCNKIRKAQSKVEKLLNKGKYPIWELNPVIAYIFETNEFYTPDKQEYIFDWIKEQERIDQLVDVFKNAIPIALSVMCFFMPGGVSIAMLILQGANAVAGAVAAYDDIQDAGAVKNMAYSQYPVSEEAQKIIDNADLSAIERNYAMAILSGAFTMLDFAECIKIARKLGIGDEVMKYFAQGRKFRLSVDETEDLVRKAGNTIIKEQVREKFNSIADNWITEELKNEFFSTIDLYAEEAVKNGACKTKSEFYNMYIERNYKYTTAYIKKIKKAYFQDGASSFVDKNSIRNAFDRYGTIGRNKDGNFVTSLVEDKKLCFDEFNQIGDAKEIASVKGVPLEKFISGIYQYIYDVDFMKSCESLNVLRTVNGTTPGASALNIPGGKTWAGKDVLKSESELIVPSIVVKGYNSTEVLSKLDTDGFFEIINPTILKEDGTMTKIHGIFRIIKRG